MGADCSAPIIGGDDEESVAKTSRNQAIKSSEVFSEHAIFALNDARDDVHSAISERLMVLLNPRYHEVENYFSPISLASLIALFILLLSIVFSE